MAGIDIGTVIGLIKKLSSEQGDIVVGNMVGESTEFLADGATTANTQGNHKIDIVNGQLQVFEYDQGIWVEIATLGSVISDYFYLDERYSELAFRDPRYNGRLDKNGVRMTTEGESMDFGDTRFDGLYLSGQTLKNAKLRLTNDDKEQSILDFTINAINNTQQVISEYTTTITAPANVDGADNNLFYKIYFDVKENAKASLTVYNQGETTNPIYQTVKDRDLNKGLGAEILAGSTEQVISKVLYLVPGQQYDIVQKFQNPTLVGGSVVGGEFVPYFGFGYIPEDSFDVYTENNLTAEIVRDLLHTLTGGNRLNSNSLYSNVVNVSSDLTITLSNKHNYVNGLIVCNNATGNININVSSGVLELGDKLTIKQFAFGTPSNPVVTISVSGGTVEGSSSLMLYTGQSVTLQYVAINNLKIVSKHNNVDDIFVDIKDPTGFIDPYDVNLSFNNITRQLTITPSLGEYEYYIKGLKHKVDTSKTSDTIFDISGTYFFYIDTNGNIDYITSFNKQTLFIDNSYIAAIYWSSELQQPIYFGRETHSINMPYSVHAYLHDNFGARFVNGLGLFGFDIYDTGEATEANCQFRYDSGVIDDEDIRHNIPASGSPAQIPIFYRTGTNSISMKIADNFPLIGANDITPTSLPKYNQNIGGNWQLTEVTGNDYWMVHYFATNDINHPVIGWLGNNVYGNAIQARDAAYDEINTLSGLPFQEFVELGSVIFKSDTYNNTPNAVIVQTEDGGNYIDFRGSRTVEGVTNVAEHGSLVGLTEPNAHPASSIDVDGTPFSGFLNTFSGTVQDAFQHIDINLNGYVANIIDDSYAGSSNVDMYEDENYTYTVAGVDDSWYVDRMSKIDPYVEDRHPASGNATGVKPVTLLEVQNLIYT